MARDNVRVSRLHLHCLQTGIFHARRTNIFIKIRLSGSYRVDVRLRAASFRTRYKSDVHAFHREIPVDRGELQRKN